MSEIIKKIIPLCLTLIILIGLFGSTANVNAQAIPAGSTVGGAAVAPPATPGTNPITGVATPPAADSNKNALYNSLTSCPPIDGCIAVIIYWLFYAIPAFLLGIAANFFDVIIALTIQSTLYAQATFIGNAWTVVRDLANIFFILVLLYAAIQTILGFGHETKKIIVHVVIMALLINFSMFFTKIVIDSSNILALVFYNKINVEVVRNGVVGDTNYVPVLAGGKDKDIAGKMMAYFDPTKILSAEFFNKFRQKTYTFSVKGALAATGVGAVAGNLIPIPGVGAGIGAVAGLVGYTLSGFGNSIPLSISIGFILIAGSIIIFATYAFLVAGISFLARMIELWVLIIFSPFAFMSFSLPFLGEIEYIGWKHWIKSLLKVSFMAPIFMFFMYLIFLIIQSNIFSSLVARPDDKNQGWMETIILMVIPALIILILLLKATQKAKEGSGQLGEALMKGAKMVGGLALGATAAAVSGGGSLALGGLAAKAASSQGLQDAAKGTGTRGIAARLALRTADYGTRASFDVRSAPGVGALAKAGGLNLGKAVEGGYEKRRADRVKREQEIAKRLEVREDEGLKQDLNKLQGEQQGLLEVSSHAISQLEKQIKAANDNASAMRAKHGSNDPIALAAGAEVVELRDKKRKIKNAKGTDAAAFTADAVAAEAAAQANPNDIKLANAAAAARAAADVANISQSGSGRSINDLEDHFIPEAEDKIEKESRARKIKYAERLKRKWTWGRTNREAAHNIIMGHKLESGTKEASH